jgi:hypothetical protein
VAPEGAGFSPPLPRLVQRTSPSWGLVSIYTIAQDSRVVKEISEKFSKCMKNNKTIALKTIKRMGRFRI